MSTQTPPSGPKPTSRTTITLKRPSAKAATGVQEQAKAGEKASSKPKSSGKAGPKGRPGETSRRPANAGPAAPRAASPRSTRPAPSAAPAARPKAVAATSTAGSEAPSGVRLSKVMAERGLCSRREADSYIEQGLVFVDGVRVTELGTRIDPNADISLAPKARNQQQQRVTILLHKPVGYVSGQPEPGYEPAVALIYPKTRWAMSGGPDFHPSHLKGLAPAGRLDIDSTGLLVLTQDGRVARQLIGDDSEVEKEYIVRVAGTLVENGLELLNHGLSLDGHKLRPAKVEWLNEDQLRFVLKEGRKRQIRRMCELVGLKVLGLKRVRIGNVRLRDLPQGQWRYLLEDEHF